MPIEIYDIKLDYRLAYCCATLWIYVFGIFILAVEATSFPFFLLLFSGPLLTYYAVMKFAVPQPDNALALEILGKEIDLEDSENGELNKPCTGVSMNVIAHRFAGLDAPENTLEALDLCYKNGAIGAEFDLILTKDFVPVLFHDSQLDRVTNVTGDIKEKTWAELQKLDVAEKHPFSEKFQGCRIPLFVDVIERVISYDMRIFIDIKEDRQEITDIVIDIYKKYPILYRRAIVSSFNFFIIYSIRKRDPNIVSSMAWRPYYMSRCSYSAHGKDCTPYSSTPIIYYYSRILDHITTWFFNNLAVHLAGFSVVLIHKDVISPELVKYWRDRNVRLIAWTVNQPLEKMYFVKNVGIAYMTDSMLGI